MNELIIPNFYELHLELYYKENELKEFINSDETLKLAVEKTYDYRNQLGLQGLVGDLQCITINVEYDSLEAAAIELINSTNYSFYEGYCNSKGRYIVLKCRNSSDIIIKSRLSGNNMFFDYNVHDKSKHLPNTRLETFFFECFDVKKYFNIQRQRGVRFASEEIIETENYLYIQTIPSCFTGNSIGVLEWKNPKGIYKDLKDDAINFDIQKPKKVHLNNIGKLDHVATRVKAVDRDSALIEFIELTNYNFAFSIYVNSLNSITNVALLDGARYAAVFTSGIKPYVDEASSGPTEKFIHNYGTRAHHLAFETDDIDYTFNSLIKDGVRFMSELVGSEAKGIKQAFSEPSPNTLLVNEYVSRYGGFKGFFIEENVTLLTKATEKQ